MVALESWLDAYLNAVEAAFGKRIWFVGIQGSYARGEATENSDIDIVLILDSVNPEDMATYSGLLDSLPHRELVCGFFSGKEVLLSWDTGELFQFYYDTLPVRGSLDAILPLLDRESVKRAIKIGAGNLYHGCVHNLLHGKHTQTLRNLYKAAVFTLRAVAFLRTGAYPRGYEELQACLTEQERQILETADFLKNDGIVQFQEMSEALFLWVQSIILEN